MLDDELMEPKLVQYTAESVNEDISKRFIDSIEYEIRSIYRKFKFKKKIKMTCKDEIAFQNAKTCHICDQKLDNDKVRDHCHLTGKYRGAAHDYCNKNYQIPKLFPVIFHNLTGYDSHIFIKNLGVSERSAMGSKIPGLINCIPNNEEKYISFTKDIEVDRFMEKDEKTGEDKEVIVKREIRFIDSFKFMASSLDKLTANLDEASFQCVNRFFHGQSVDLVRRKGVYPYDYVDSIKKLSETKLTPQEQFYSEINYSSISDEDHERARKVWKYFDMKTMRDYHNLYLKTDVLLLADVFEKFRDVCIENYKLDPAWYYTSPGLAWNACLEKTEVRLELLNDVDMLLMIEKGIRGRVSTITKRHAEANNPYIKTYDSSSPNKYITYLDANNLYGWAMSQPLPTHGFEWMSEEELKNWRSHSCILEVDLEYPKVLHDLHNDYPLAPERLKIGGIEKLIPNLYDKKNYVVHHKTLKQYKSLGLKITKIHRGTKFEESAWLKPYINLNSDLRTKAKNDFEKDFFKLMNNSVFGKTMENIRSKVDIRLVTNEDQARKLISKPNYQHRTYFCENLTAIHMRKTRLLFNKPVYLGMCILDLSKILMYDFHYNYIKQKYGENAELLFTDTDSLMYEITTEDFYRDITSDVHKKFDTSNFAKDHKSVIPTGVNKKVIGMMKDEAGGKQITEFVGLRSKLYSFKIDEKEEKKCKGVKKSEMKRTINFKDYKDCLFTGNKQMRSMNVIRSHKHEVFSETINKVALSSEDDKRIIFEDKIHTLAHGHYKT